MITEIAPAPERVAAEPARPRKKRRAWDEVPRRQIYVPLSIYLLFTLIPFYWILLFALRPAGSTSLVPWPMTFDHFGKVWNERAFGTYFQNSVLVGIATLLMTTLVALAGGYALARFNFKIKKAFMLALLCTQFVPGALLLVPLFEIFANLRMINSLVSVIIAETVFQLPLSMILISGFIRNVPYSLEEAAWVDGCN
ncbi:MAG: carbohydrate ABC transporter permease, partial [Streptomyces sp.]|nr:carbohydrate ABC transporter permease [Streptomyces sp.]